MYIPSKMPWASRGVHAKRRGKGLVLSIALVCSTQCRMRPERARPVLADLPMLLRGELEICPLRSGSSHCFCFRLSVWPPPPRPMERIQTLVVGAGVVGLACARALARAGREVVVADAGSRIGTGTSSRNSEVVHAGIYYPAGSLKAVHCVQGAASLLRFCEEHRVAHRVCGKLIVATHSEQHAALAGVAAHAEKSGVRLQELTASDVHLLEPEVVCTSALLSPRTAVVDSHGFMEALWADAEDAGATLCLRTRVADGGELLPGSGVAVQLETLGSEGVSEQIRVEAHEVVNCAGLAAPAVARALGLTQDVPTPHFCKGNYYALQGSGRAAKPFSRLVYPLPEKNTSGLGVHATVDLAGRVRFGPDVEWLPSTSEDGRRMEEMAYDAAADIYRVDASRSDAFYAEVRRYWPGLPDGALVPDYSGIRPKLSAAGEPAVDFRIDAVSSNGRPSIINMFGIESPGLTASMSLADEVLRRLSASSE